jgi:ABC-type sugar transport system substrate-binding protein
MKKGIQMLLVVAFLLVMGLPAFAAGKDVVVGITLQNMTEEFMIALENAINAKAAEYPNLKIVLNDAEGRTEKQVAQMDSFISQGVNAIIICPRDQEALVQSCKNALAAGIPVVTLSANIAENIGQVCITSENKQGGALQAEYVMKAIGGKGKVAIFRGPLGADAEIGRGAGYDEILAGFPNVSVVYNDTANWQREEAMTKMENLLQTHSDLAAVMCMNDGMALGVIQAVKAKGLLGEINISGIDAIPDAITSIEAGELNATCFQDAAGQGAGSVELAMKLIAGEKVPDWNNIPFQLVTPANVKDYK